MLSYKTLFPIYSSQTSETTVWNRAQPNTPTSAKRHLGEERTRRNEKQGKPCMACVPPLVHTRVAVAAERGHFPYGTKCGHLQPLPQHPIRVTIDERIPSDKVYYQSDRGTEGHALYKAQKVNTQEICGSSFLLPGIVTSPFVPHLRPPGVIPHAQPGSACGDALNLGAYLTLLRIRYAIPYHAILSVNQWQKVLRNCNFF